MFNQCLFIYEYWVPGLKELTHYYQGKLILLGTCHDPLISYGSYCFLGWSNINIPTVHHMEPNVGPFNVFNQCFIIYEYLGPKIKRAYPLLAR